MSLCVSRIEGRRGGGRDHIVHHLGLVETIGEPRPTSEETPGDDVGEVFPISLSARCLVFEAFFLSAEHVGCAPFLNLIPTI